MNRIEKETIRVLKIYHVFQCYSNVGKYIWVSVHVDNDMKNRKAFVSIYQKYY